MIAGGANNDDSQDVFVTVSQDDKDVNIIANGYIVAYFDSEGYLHLIYDLHANGLPLPLDSAGRIKIRRS
jgi:hypothetical protein